MPRSQLEKLWLLGAGLLALLMVVIGYFLFIGPQRSDTDQIDSQVASAQTQNAVLQSRIAALQRQAKDLPKYEAQLAQAHLALPSTSGLPDFLRTLQAIGSQTLAKVTTLTVAGPADVTSLAAAGPAPTATASAAPGGASTGPSVAGVHVYALPISASVSGTVAQLGAFLTQLQSVQPRAVLISQLELTAGQAAKGGATPTLALTMQAFVAPSSAAENAELSAASHP
jgi:type IV pilus assembly protein PilO